MQPAEEGTIAAKSFPRYGRIEGRYMGLGRPADPEHIGDTFLWMKRSEKGPNTFSQPIKDLEPGRLYSMKMFTCDYQDLVNPRKRRWKRPTSSSDSVVLEGVEVDTKRSFTEMYPSSPEPPIPVWITYHWNVFRARATTAKLTVSDWPSEDKPTGSLRPGADVQLPGNSAVSRMREHRMSNHLHSGNAHRHAFASLQRTRARGAGRRQPRGMLKASLAGLAGLSVPALLKQQALAVDAGRPLSRKSVILLWMAGGPSHIDTWDPKPDRPYENRGPFGVIRTKLPGVLVLRASAEAGGDARQVHAHPLGRLPAQQPRAEHGHADRPTCDAEPRVNREAELYPAIGSIVAKHHGANHPAMPPYVAFMRSRSHLAFAGYLGKQYDPFIANQAARLPIYDLVGEDTGQQTSGELFRLAGGLDARADPRPPHDCSRRSIGLRSELDQSGSMDALDRYGQQAVEMVLGRRAQEAFDLSREPAATARALRQASVVPAGAAGPAAGRGGRRLRHARPELSHGLRHLGHARRQHSALRRHSQGPGAAVAAVRSSAHDAGRRPGPARPAGRVLVIAMGEFGRTPQIGTQGSTDGRNHWPVVMSMCWPAAACGTAR